MTWSSYGAFWEVLDDNKILAYFLYNINNKNTFLINIRHNSYGVPRNSP